MTTSEIDQPQAVPAPRSLRRRLFIGIVLVFWFTLLMVPCFFLTLAFNQEIVIPTGGLPDQHVRIWLVMEPFERGLAVSLPSVQAESPTEACMTFTTRFLLWQGRASNVEYCECFSRADASADWTMSSVLAQACPAGE